MKTYLYITTNVDILEQKTKSSEINKEEHIILLKKFKKILYNNHIFVIFYNDNTINKENREKASEKGSEKAKSNEKGSEKASEKGNEKASEKNIINLPFIDFDIFGDFILYSTNNENKIISLTQSKLFKIINKNNKNFDEEYSSDDFNI